jgi:hypothetical protein
MASNLDGHPKIRTAGADGREVFLYALRRNAEYNLGGIIPRPHLQPWLIAYEMMRDEVTVSHGLSRCVTAGLLLESPGHYAIAGWDDEWAKRPLTDQERKAKQRGKDRAVTATPETTSTGVTHSHETIVTPRDGHALEESRGDKKRVEESKGEHSLQPPVGRKRKPRTQSVEVELPSDWQPTPEHAELAEKRGVDLALQAQKFRNHAEAHARRAVRWNAAFTNWLLGSHPERGGSNGFDAVMRIAQGLDP